MKTNLAKEVDLFEILFKIDYAFKVLAEKKPGSLKGFYGGIEANRKVWKKVRPFLEGACAIGLEDLEPFEL